MSESGWVARKSERLRVTLNARCTADGAESGVTLVNITPEGCCMTTGTARVTPGTAVLVRLENGEALTGLVRWHDGDKAGIEFDRLLSPARVEYLRREHSTFLSETDWNTRQVRSVL